MIKPMNKNIDIKALESRLSNELEERLELGCYPINACGCDDNIICSCHSPNTNCGTINICGNNNPCGCDGYTCACDGDYSCSCDGDYGCNDRC